MAKMFSIYQIRRHRDGKAYVGLTARSVAERVRFHWMESRSKGVHPGGLAAALRHVQMSTKGQHAMQEVEGLGRLPAALLEHFEVRVLEAFKGDAALARDREGFWVDQLGTRYPDGFNIQPGGSSAGCVFNAQPLEVEVAGRRLSFASLSEAHRYFEQHLDHLKGASLPTFTTLRARLAAGWSAEEAFGFVAHEDLRRVREAFHCQGQRFTSLKAASEATGLGLETLRSRLHRAKNSGRAHQDLLQPLPKAYQASSCLPHPENPEQQRLSAKDFAQLTGLAQSTVSHRARRFREKYPDSTSPYALLKALLEGEDRRKWIELTLPTGEHFQGGINALAGKVHTTPDLQAFRIQPYALTTLKNRLKACCKKEPTPSPEKVFQALGLQEVAGH